MPEPIYVPDASPEEKRLKEIIRGTKARDTQPPAETVVDTETIERGLQATPEPAGAQDSDEIAQRILAGLGPQESRPTGTIGPADEPSFEETLRAPVQTFFPFVPDFPAAMLGIPIALEEGAVGLLSDLGQVTGVVDGVPGTDIRGLEDLTPTSIIQRQRRRVGAGDPFATAAEILAPLAPVPPVSSVGRLAPPIENIRNLRRTAPEIAETARTRAQQAARETARIQQQARIIDEIAGTPPRHGWPGQAAETIRRVERHVAPGYTFEKPVNRPLALPMPAVPRTDDGAIIMGGLVRLRGATPRIPSVRNAVVSIRQRMAQISDELADPNIADTIRRTLSNEYDELSATVDTLHPPIYQRADPPRQQIGEVAEPRQIFEEWPRQGVRQEITPDAPEATLEGFMEAPNVQAAVQRLEQLANDIPVPNASLPDRPPERAIRTTPPGTSPKVNGQPTGQVHHPDEHVVPETAEAELLETWGGTPIADVPMDVGASRFLETNDINDFIHTIRRGTPPVSEAIREGPLRGLKPGSGLYQDITRLMQTMDSSAVEGGFNGPMQRAFVHPNRRVLIASLRYQDNNTVELSDILTRHSLGSNAQQRQVTDVIEAIGLKDVRVANPELMKRPEVRRALKGLSATEAQNMLSAAKEIRRMFERMRLDINKARVARGAQEIALREQYVPWIPVQGMWNRMMAVAPLARSLRPADLKQAVTLFRHKFPDSVLQRGEMPDYIHPGEAFDPRALARLGGLEDMLRERNISKLFLEYNAAAQKDIFFTEIVRNGRAITRTLRDRAKLAPGHPHRADTDVAADTIDTYIDQAYLAVPDALTREARKFAAPVVDFFMGLRRQLNRAVFPLNPGWNLFVQTTSSSLTLVRYGPRNTFDGMMEYLFNPTSREWVNNNVYSAIIKRHRSARLAQQDLSETASVTLSHQNSVLDNATDFLNFFTNQIESFLTGGSILAARRHGMQRGLRGRALLEYASEGGAKTQSMYNIHDRPGAMRSRVVQTIAPFQTFMFEMFNTVMEHAPRVKIGSANVVPLTHQERTRRLLTFIAALYVQNLVADAVIDRKPWNVSSFVPFYGILAGALNRQNTGINTLPARYVAEFWTAVDDVIGKDQWNRFFTWVNRYHVPGGTQINRWRQSTEAVKNGGVFDVQERELFRVESTTEHFDFYDTLMMFVNGPYATRGGREWQLEQREKLGPFAELIGFRHTLREDYRGVLEEMTHEFGAPIGDETKKVHPKDLFLLRSMTQRFLPQSNRQIAEAVGENEEVPFAPKHYAIAVRDARRRLPRLFRDHQQSALTEEYLRAEQVFETFDALPQDTDVRRRYLWANPEVDAMLYFWGRRTSLQSSRAMVIVREMMTQWNIPDDALPPLSRAVR